MRVCAQKKEGRGGGKEGRGSVSKDSHWSFQANVLIPTVDSFRQREGATQYKVAGYPSNMFLNMRCVCLRALLPNRMSAVLVTAMYVPTTVTYQCVRELKAFAANRVLVCGRSLSAKITVCGWSRRLGDVRALRICFDNPHVRISPQSFSLVRPHSMRNS